MATGDRNDMLARLQSLVPRGWFGDAPPVLTALLKGFAAIFANVYAVIVYAKAQTRIATASDGWLDLISADFFGSNLPRKANQSDASFRAVILANLFQEKATRKAIVNVVTNLTGRSPVVFEPNRPADVAVMGVPMAGGQNYMGIQTGMYSGPARMGSLATPFTALITVYRPIATGGSAGGAYMDAPKQAALNTPLAKSYTNSLTFQTSSATDADIYAAIDQAKPVATIMWVAITN